LPDDENLVEAVPDRDDVPAHVAGSAVEPGAGPVVDERPLLR